MKFNKNIKSILNVNKFNIKLKKNNLMEFND